MSFTVLVTSGGTISRIDDVRHIGNFSEGTTGAAIVEEFLRRGAVVHHLHARRSKRAFRSALAIDPMRPLSDEMARARAAHEEWNRHAARLHEHPFETFDEYLEAVGSLLSSGSVDAVVLAAAVSDYGAQPREGKISSEEDVLRIELFKHPKVIARVKEWSPRAFLVGFKLLSGAGVLELIDVAYKHGIRNHSNLQVANTLRGRDFAHRTTFLITPEKGVTPVTLESLPVRLADSVMRRASRRHYRTEVSSDATCREKAAAGWKPALFDRFRADVERLFRLALFEPYYSGAREHFGFFARRVAQGGFLITARGSDKERMPVEDIVHVEAVDFAARVVRVHGRKASLNANTAARIFAERPDVDVILHAHVFPGVERRTDVDFAPGTEEDVEESLKHLGRGTIVELVDHGILAVGRTVDELVAALATEPAYTRFPEIYDVIYHRFRASDDFLRLVTGTAGCDRAVLDLCGGTGDLAERLLARGYRDLSLADLNEPMLAVARRKLGGAVACHQADMRALALPRKFDAILVRQAIGYLMDGDGLRAGLGAIRDHLSEGGVLLFNAPNHRAGREYGGRDLAYEALGYCVRIVETNTVEGTTLAHAQRCTLYRPDGSEFRRVYDINRFALFTKEEFALAAGEAGFRSIDFLGKGLEPWTEGSRSLYAIARR